MQNLQCTTYSVQFITQSVQCIAYSVPCTSLQCAIQSIQCTTYSKCKTCSIKFPTYSIHCTTYSVQGTARNVHSAACGALIPELFGYQTPRFSTGLPTKDETSETTVQNLFLTFMVLCWQKLFQLYYLIKEWNLCHKLRFSNTYIFAILCRRPQIFQSMNSITSNNLNLKYQRFTPSGCQDIRILSLC